MKIICNECFEGILNKVDLNEGKAYREFLIPNYRYICDECGEEFKDIEVVIDLEGEIVEVKRIK